VPKIGKYGKRPVRPETLASFAHRDALVAALAPLPAPPTECRYDRAVTTWPMYDNDAIGDCTIAAAGHLIESWSASAGASVVPLASDIVSAYSAVSGYNPVTGANDTGADEQDVLAYWQATGIAGNQLAAWAPIEPADLATLRQAIWLFGGVCLGIEVRQSAERQFESGQPWDYVSPWFNPVVGFHAIPILGYDAQYFYVCTWGAIQPVTPAFVQGYADEAYAIVDAAFVGASGASASGFNLQQLQTDLRAVSSQG
jgi:hypothetical protein